MELTLAGRLGQGPADAPCTFKANATDAWFFQRLGHDHEASPENRIALVGAEAMVHVPVGHTPVAAHVHAESTRFGLNGRLAQRAACRLLDEHIHDVLADAFNVEPRLDSTPHWRERRKRATLEFAAFNVGKEEWGAAATNAKRQMQRGFTLDIVVAKRKAIFELFASKQEALVDFWDAFRRLDHSFDVLDGCVAGWGTFNVNVFPDSVLTKSCMPRPLSYNKE
ncbi:Aste57867_15310 [Aphanomyces stellatus]|uniref:Aste57867_15310 protein n=1 Tax=Aphanomyces stellatus TaxID=120398 RepID=A0A485L2V4_9STRA|nr:hypothetical protein As57867_015254 [Aphanomyces stellatus]VFT92119.1 Aste57867_15310 [Aphanomyces stellatus]